MLAETHMSSEVSQSSQHEKLEQEIRATEMESVLFIPTAIQ